MPAPPYVIFSPREPVIEGSAHEARAQDMILRLRDLFNAADRGMTASNDVAPPPASAAHPRLKVVRP